VRIKTRWHISVTLFKLGLLALLFCSGPGCAPSARVVPFTVDAAGATLVHTGIVFYLPKNLLEVTLTYTEFEKRVWKADAKGTAIKKDAHGKALQPAVSQHAAVVEPVKVRLKTIPDSRMGFLLDSESLNGFFYDTKLTVETAADGRLKAINHSADDTTAAVAANLSKTALQLAKIAAVAGETVTELKKIRDVEVVRLLDPATLNFVKKDALYEAVYSDKEEIKQFLPDGTTPDAVTIKFSSDTDLGALSKITASDLRLGSEPAAELRGIPYRISRPVAITITCDNFEQQTHRVLFSDYLSFVQAGGIAYVPITGRMFSTTTCGLELYDGEGSLKKYVFNGTSAAEKISKTAGDMSADAAKQLEDLNAKELELRLARLKKERDILDVEQDIADADPGSIQSRTERLKQIKALLDAELAAEEAAGKK
jgi:hypothetical protein